MPGGRDLFISEILSSMFLMTLAVLEPNSFNTMPTTFSPSPLTSAAPLFIAGSIWTEATSFRKIGVP